MKLRLTIDVEYDPQGVPEDVLWHMMDYIPRRAFGEGLFTGDTEATVEHWSHSVCRINERGNEA